MSDHTYWVSYNYKNDTAEGPGAYAVTSEHPIATYSDVMAVATNIAQDWPEGTVIVINNWIPLPGGDK